MVRVGFTGEEGVCVDGGRDEDGWGRGFEGEVLRRRFCDDILRGGVIHRELRWSVMSEVRWDEVRSTRL